MGRAFAGVIDRRAFLKTSVAAVAVTILPIAAFGAAPGFDAREAMPPGDAADWRRTPSTAGWRIEGVPKVTGAKLYAADFRAADMPGWPPDTAHALLLKTSDATHVFESIDLSALDPELKPDRVVLAADLALANVTVPGFFAGDLLVPAGKTPLYLGQPVAILIWNDFARFALAKPAVQFGAGVVRYGAETGPVEEKPYTAARFVRVAGATPDAEDVYSPILAGWTFPLLYKMDDRPEWAVPSDTGSPAAKASFYGDQIQAEIAAGGADLLVLDRSFDTQSIDQVFMEPEAGLAWYDPATKKLELVLGVQSPYQAADDIAARWWRRPPATRQSAASSPTSPMSAVPSAARTIRSIRSMWRSPASSRRAARCASPTTASSSSSSASSGTPSPCGAGSRSSAAAARSSPSPPSQDLDGGGLANLSAAVAFVGATASIGIYDVPKVDVQTVARHSRAVTAGSMRGFGALQTMTALEVLIDEAASALGRDPVAFRKANLLETGGKTMVGNVISGVIRSGEVLDRLAAKPIWSGRAAEKARRNAADPAKAYGVGLACVSTVFGSGSDPAFALVEVDPDGRIVLTSQAVEIGTGNRDRARGADCRQARDRRRRGAARPALRLGACSGCRSRQSLHHHPREAGRGGEEPALGSRHRAGHHRVDLGPYPHRGRRRGSQRHPPLRALAGGARDLVVRSLRRPGGGRVHPLRGRPLRRRRPDRRRNGAAAAPRARRQDA